MLASPHLVEYARSLHEHTQTLGIPVLAKPFDIDTLLGVVACRAAALASVRTGE
jgi:hypothetical protein